MTLPRLLLEVRLACLRDITWEWLDGGGVRCSLGGDYDFSALGADGRSALERLLKRLQVIR